MIDPVNITIDIDSKRFTSSESGVQHDHDCCMKWMRIVCVYQLALLVCDLAMSTQFALWS